jgi:DNA-directed RNA polymerase specialized sigma24 family protein
VADSLNKWRRQLRSARRRRERAFASAEEATKQAAETAHEAHEAGLPVREIAELLGLTRKAVYDMWSRHSG